MAVKDEKWGECPKGVHNDERGEAGGGAPSDPVGEGEE